MTRGSSSPDIETSNYIIVTKWCARFSKMYVDCGTAFLYWVSHNADEAEKKFVILLINSYYSDIIKVRIALYKCNITVRILGSYNFMYIRGKTCATMRRVPYITLHFAIHLDTTCLLIVYFFESRLDWESLVLLIPNLTAILSKLSYC